ncbi:M20 family metallopeptidase [Albimonas sp. CAU 1670]|uniref:M20 family metallopeptidase n=1 Tax=Albimonas sp. CAU 1670 TaxID=3032599 RepID=UPI0023DA30EC|nr:M20 family metallopeptidase [Albimonas sp. CAU 1670]MDF2231309.1 M20 family metallopeptidase [Albimonas sp. CAU 1670]
MTLLRPEQIDAAPLVALIREWVEIETPSERPDLIDALLDKVEAAFEGLPVERTRFPATERGGQLLLRYAPEGCEGPAITTMGHVDTVWAVGTLARRPIVQEGERLFGPGIFDMKAGSCLAAETLRRIAAEGIVPPRPLQVLLTGDEEIGSDASRALIERLAAESAMVLIPEPSFGPDIAVVTARKGWGRFVLRAHGRAAHAGGNLFDGRSAIHEIARQIIDIEGRTDRERGLTFNVGVVAGGTRPNVVPAEAEALVDMRAVTTAEAEAEAAGMLARTAFGPDVRLEVSGGVNRPPYERTAAVARLFEATRRLSESLGMPLAEISRGGVSDGNLAAAMGTPVLDGLGCGGGGAHAEDEHIDLSTVAPRAALMRGMMLSEDFLAEALG